MGETGRRAERLVNSIRGMVTLGWALVNLLFGADGPTWWPLAVLGLTVMFSAAFTELFRRPPGTLPDWLPYATMGADVAAVVLVALSDHALASLMPGAFGLVILTTAFRMSIGLTAAASAVSLVVWLGFGGVAGVFSDASAVVSNLVGLGVVGTTALFLVQESRDRIAAAAAAESRRQEAWELLAMYLTTEQARRVLADGSVSLRPARREVSTVVARLGGLSVLTAEEADRALATVSSYLDACARVALRADAAVDRYFGGELRAVLNAPLLHADHARRALALARDLHLAVAYLNQERAARGAASLYLTVVVHTAEAWVGLLGDGARDPSRQRFLVASEESPLIMSLLELAAPGETVATAASVSRAGVPEIMEAVELPGRPGVMAVARIRTLGPVNSQEREFLPDELTET